MPARAYIALGSNLGERHENLARAMQALQAHAGISVSRVSSCYATSPVGGPPGQGDFLNAAAELQTDLEPEQLLSVLLEIERSQGRIREQVDGPRTLDLDFLLYDDQIQKVEGLVLPHPRLQNRLFVLEPLAEIAPQAMHPLLHASIAELLQKARMDPALAGQRVVRVPYQPCRSQTAIPGRELAGLRALVTGSTSGIGRAIALELASAGASVIIHRRRVGDDSDEVAKATKVTVESFGVSSGVLLADLREAEQCRELVEQAWQTWNGLDIWINNAGADTLTGEAAQWSFERKLQELLAVDLTATMLLAREVGRRMQEQGSGVILNMGWDQVDTGMEGDSGQLFAASKGAVMAFSKSLALSLAPQVRVNCLAPGWIQTKWGETASDYWQERVLRETPLGRWGTPRDVAATARWLVSPAAGFVTGQVIRVNGGAVR